MRPNQLHLGSILYEVSNYIRIVQGGASGSVWRGGNLFVSSIARLIGVLCDTDTEDVLTVPVPVSGREVSFNQSSLSLANHINSGQNLFVLEPG